MMKFIRYGSRHRLWFPRGYKGWVLPILNPLESSSHGAGRKRTWSLEEPRWFYFARKRLAYAGPATCSGHPARWERMPDGNRTCSMCGSIHQDDLMALCRMTLGDERYGIDGTDKSYKVYVRQPGVRNASEGAIKFYMQHAPAAPCEEDIKLFADAKRVTHERWAERVRIPARV